MVCLAFNILEFDSVVFQEESPTNHSLGLNSLERIVLVNCVDGDVGAAIEHGSELFEGLHHGEEFLLANRVVELCRIELA